MHSPLLLLALLTPAEARDAGYIGKSTSGCGACHGSAASATTSASFSTSATTVAPGDSVTVGFVVGTTSSTRTAAGFNVSATGGTLVPGSNNYLSGTELTQPTAQAMSSGSVTFNFSWTAPSTEGTYTLRGAGNAVNDNGLESGDGWAVASTVSIVVDDGCEDVDGDGFEVCDDGSGSDCDDADSAISPAASETCDGVDNDCDDTIDESSAVDALTWYLDADNDGYGLSSSFTVSCEPVSGYVASDEDCNDGDAAVSPLGVESCNGVDDDCDGVTDPDSSVDAATWYRDADGDGHAGTTTTAACSQPSGYLATSTDCDDTRPTVSPSASETCDGVDQDCDGTADDEATDRGTYYLDGDGDGYGDSAASTLSCSLPSGYSTVANDCNDADAAYNPGATEACTDIFDYNCDGSLSLADLDGDGYAACEECNDSDAAVNPAGVELCNGVDDDCDGTIDPDSSADAASWYTDADTDGYGDAGSVTVSCSAPTGSVADDSDCDDADPASFPGAPETCDGVDDDCNGLADDAATDALTFYADSDGDGAGDPASTAAACVAPTGYVEAGDDCDDSSAAVSPSGVELCNGVDDDCNGETDEPTAADASFWYADTDGDGYGDALAGTIACTAPDGFVADAQDCDDTDAALNPTAEEVWYDGVDQDCDGNDADQDLDGWPSPADCNDADAAINPDATEVVYDGVDADCSGGSDYDADADGFESEAYGGTDCDDADATTYPGAEELPDDEVENDCDVRNDHDRDDDGHDGTEWGGDDCDDANSEISPSAAETWYDGVDSNCKGDDDYDRDGDGVGVDDDCDDFDADVAATCEKDVLAGSGCGDCNSGGAGPSLAASALLALFIRRRR